MTHFPKPDDPRGFGLDVSRYNSVDWITAANFRAPKVAYAMIRSGQAHAGAFDDIDRRFFYNTANCKAAGIPRVTYHVHYPASAPGPQIANILRIGRLIGNDWGDDIYINGIKVPRFWVDSELIQGLTGLKWIQSTGDFIFKLQDALGEAVGDYIGKWILDKYKVPIQPWYKDIYWWLAQYGNGTYESGPLVYPAGIPPERVLFHQTTSSLEGMLFGAPLGIRVDGNRWLRGG